jgi:hypothetical protein
MSAKTLPEILDPVGNLRPLGNKPPPKGFLLPSAPPLAVMPEPQWEAFDLRESYSFIKVCDQNGRGACNGFAAVKSLEWARAIAGEAHVDLSAWYVYAILCGGVDRGSSIEEALDHLARKGCPPDSEVAYGVINPGRLSDAAHKQAPRFRIEIGAPIRSFAELMTAAQLRKPCNVSVCAGSRFNRLDANGVCGVDGGWGNHAVTGALGAKRLPSGKWAILYQNSWNTTYGDEGFMWCTEEHTRHQYFAAYAVGAISADPDDPDRPPVAI